MTDFKVSLMYKQVCNYKVPCVHSMSCIYLVCVDSPGCECGFMSVERMRILLELDTVNKNTSYPQRQQITPDMRFTCDGWITKWIIGAIVANGSLYPEIQVWRNTSNTYQKINGIPIVIPDMSSIQRYEISNFHPIAIQAGDVLGVFLPPATSSRLTLLSEDTTSPTNYYLTTNSSDSESPYDMIDLENTPSLMSQGYHLLVTVEIGLTLGKDFTLLCGVIHIICGIMHNGELLW